MQRQTQRAFAVIKLVMLSALGACASSARPNAATRQATPAATSSVPSSSDTMRATRPTREFALPAPDGHVNDLAGVLPDSVRRVLEAKLRLIRAVTEGEIVLVTMPALPGVTPQQMAQRIGIEWGVGARTGRAHQAGAVVLLIPKETSSDGKGHCRLELGDGANAFIPDSAATTICEAAVPFFRTRD